MAKGNRRSKNHSVKDFVPTANPEMAAAFRDIRRSSATSPQESRFDRKRTRAAVKSRYISDYS